MENGLLIFQLIAAPFADVISMTLRMRKENKNMEIKNYDIPTGMTGRINQFLKVFDLDFLEKHGIELQRVTVGTAFQHNVNQYLVKTPYGKMAVCKADESTLAQRRITYLGNANWEVADN